MEDLTLGLLLQANVEGQLVVARAAGEASQVPGHSFFSLTITTTITTTITGEERESWRVIRSLQKNALDEML